MKKFSRTILLLFVAMLLSACQLTPDKQVIVNKGGGELENKVLQSAQNTGVSPSAAEGRVVWSETKTANFEKQGDYTVAVNMDAKMPEVPGKVPVYIIKPKELSTDFIKKAARYLMKGEIFDGKDSKQDITAEILAFKEDISSHTIRQGYQDQADKYIDFLNKRYKKATDGNSEAKYEYIKDDYGNTYMPLKSYPGDGSIMVFQAITDCFFFNINKFNKNFRSLNDISGEDVQAKGTKTTYKEALAEADSAMKALFDEPFDMAYTEITDTIDYQEYLWNDSKKDTSEGQAYVFYYTREYGGIPSLFIKYAPIVSTDDTLYAAPYSREGACVVVDDRGIAEMWYDSYSDTVKTLNENAALLPFEKILDKFKDGVFHNNLWGFPGSTAKIDITRIEFGMVREPFKDNSKQYMMVPAWNFVGNTDNGSSGSGKNVSILALNAIDGSVITDYDSMTEPK